MESAIGHLEQSVSVILELFSEYILQIVIHNFSEFLIWLICKCQVRNDVH